MGQIHYWLGTDLQTQPRIEKNPESQTCQVTVVVGIWTDFRCRSTSVAVTVQAETLWPRNPGERPLAPVDKKEAALLTAADVGNRSARPSSTQEPKPKRMAGRIPPRGAKQTTAAEQVDRWNSTRAFASVRAAMVDQEKSGKAGHLKYAKATFEVPVGSLVAFEASVQVRGKSGRDMSGPLPVWVVDPTFGPAEVVGARAELDLDLAHYWVMFHRRDNGLEQFRIDLLRVDDTQMPIKSLKVQVGDNLIDLSHCPDMLDESTWTAWVDQRSDSVHLTIPREIELDSITVLTAAEDGAENKTVVELRPPKKLRPVPMMIIAYAIQGLNDLFWHPVRGINDVPQDTTDDTDKSKRRLVLRSYAKPRNFAEIVYCDEYGIYSGNPTRPENRIRDGYYYMIEAQRTFKVKAVWAWNAGALLLLKHGLTGDHWAHLTAAVQDGTISAALAGYGAHRGCCYQGKTNELEIRENADLIDRVFDLDSYNSDGSHTKIPTFNNGIYFGDSRIYEASDGELEGFEKASDLLRYLVMERSTVTTFDATAPTGERRLFPGKDRCDFTGNHLWQDTSTKLSVLLNEDVLRDTMMNATETEVRRGLAPLATRRLMMEALAAQSASEGPPPLMTACDDIEHFCGAGWFDGDAVDFAAGYSATMAWLSEHPWVQVVTPSQLGVDGPFESMFPSRRQFSVTSSTDASMDPEGASVSHQGSRLQFDLWRRAWEQFRVAWLGCTLGEISRPLEAALVDWPKCTGIDRGDSLYDLAWLYFLANTHENCWSKQPTNKRDSPLDEPFAWDPEDFAVSESIHVRNAWVYLNASIWAQEIRQHPKDTEDHVMSVGTMDTEQAGWLAPLIRRTHSADRWWALRPRRDGAHYADDGLFWDRDNLSNTILYNDQLLAVLDQNGGVITHLFARHGEQVVSVSGTCKAYQFLTLNPQLSSDGPRVQNTVFTPNHAYIASDVFQARPRHGSFADQRQRVEKCWWPNNFDRYVCEPLDGVAGVRFSYRVSTDTLPTEPLDEGKTMAALRRDGDLLRSGRPGIVWHQDPEFTKEISLQGRTLTIRYHDVRPDHVVANEFTVDLLDQLRGGDPQQVTRRKEGVWIKAGPINAGQTRVVVRPDANAMFTAAAGTDAEPLRHRVLTDAVLIQAEPPDDPADRTKPISFSYTITVEGPGR